MNPVLSQLLDRIIAAKFGRPARTEVPREGDPYTTTLHYNDAHGFWHWSKGENDSAIRPELCPEASWLGHLIEVCGKNKWGLSLAPADGWWCADIGGWEASEPDAVHALARAMLAVPEGTR